MKCKGARPKVLPSKEHIWLVESTPIHGFQGLEHALLYTLKHINYCFFFSPLDVGVSMHKQLLTCDMWMLVEGQQYATVSPRQRHRRMQHQSGLTASLSTLHGTLNL